MRFGVCNEMFLGCSVFEVIEKAAGLGYHGVELAPYSLTDDLFSFPASEQRRIKDFARDHGLEVIGLHWLFVLPKGLHLTSADSDMRRRTLEVFRKLMEIAANTGARLLTMGSPGQRSYPSGETYENAFQRMVAFLKEVSGELEARNQTLCLEPLEPELTNFITSTRQACDLADAAGSPAIGITLDTHFLRWECAQLHCTESSLFRLAGRRLAHLHIQDDNSRAPGTGNADFRGFLEAVRESGWDRYVSMETFASEEPGEGERMAAEGMEWLRRNLGRPADR